MNKQPVKNISFLTGFFILIVLLAGCESPSSPYVLYKGQTMGTSYHVTISGDFSSANRGTLQVEIDERLRSVNQSFSTYIKQSEISEFNRYQGLDAQKKSKAFMYLLEEA
ncbi:MAG TPA: FAD:protein FMN transferase, partial [Cycloclasticus sp.]|nr:FAD:protein FMN transferase [Cycloclasticus sp.]